MANPVVYFEIMGKSGPDLRNFYSSIFDWKFQTMGGMDYGTMPAEKGGIGGGVGSEPSGSSSVTIYVEVDDINAYLQKIEALGGKTVMPRTVIPNVVTFAQFTDPEGHLIGLTEAASS